MKLFNRNKNDQSALPQEVKEYYQSEKRERRGFAWLLALGTLIVTILVAAALFFGGRWLYRTVFGDDSGKSDTQQQEEGVRVDENGNVQGNNSPSNSTDQNATGNDTPTSNQNPAANGTNNPTGDSSPSTGTNTQGTQNAPAATPSTGSSELINTGPGDE